jgi:hypothetical protein
MMEQTDVQSQKIERGEHGTEGFEKKRKARGRRRSITLHQQLL